MPAATEKRRARRWIVATIALVAWIAIVLAGGDLVLQRRFIASLRGPRPPIWLSMVQGRLPPELLRRVGFFANTKRSAFGRFRSHEAPSVTRICAFGDSFTHGDEVDDASDYPTLLQTLLDRTSTERFEVLNFGSGSFGFHQTFMIWDALAQRYGCDRILLGPATFFPERDTSFNHAGTSNPYYLHARYVLDGDDVRLVEVPGQTFEERFEEYFRFLPHVDYLRFDRAPPVFLRAALRQGQTIDNPFYYLRDDVRTEAFETYRRLLRHLADAGQPVLLAAGSEIGAMAAELHQDGVVAFDPIAPQTFPYRAPRNHYGAMGNELLARQFLARLVPGAPQQGLVLRTRPLPSGATPAAETLEAAPPLSQYANVHAEIAGVTLGHFVNGTSASSRKGSPELLRSAGVVSLVHVAGPHQPGLSDGSSIADGCFVAVDRPLRGPLQVCVKTERSGGSARCLGRIALPAPGVNLGTLEIGGVSIEDRPVLGEESRLVLTAQDPEVAALLKGARTVTIEVDGVAILGGSARGDWFLLSPGKRGCFRLRANANGRVDLGKAPDSGVVELVLQPRRGTPVHAPIATWDKLVVPFTDGARASSPALVSPAANR